jgi:hypothetical protein
VIITPPTFLKKRILGGFMLKKFLAVGFVLTILYFFIPEIAKFSAIIALLWLAASKLSEVAQKSKFVWIGFSVVVFLVSFTFVFADYFQMTFLSIKEKLYTIDLRLGSDPETVDTRIQRKTSDGLELAKRNADSLDALRIDMLVSMSRRDPVNAKIYIKNILEISDSSKKRNEAIGKFRESINGSSGYVQTVSSEKTTSKELNLNEKMGVFVRAGIPTKTGINMNIGNVFEFSADGKFLCFDNQDAFNRIEKKELDPKGAKYWSQTDETEPMILEGLPGSDVMWVEVTRVK